MIRILICDDQVVVCEGLRAILGTINSFEVVGVANDGQQALELAEQLHPDLVLMDLKMPVMNGVQATAHLRASFPNMRVLVLTTYDMDEWVLDAVRSGASGYLLKDTPRDELVAAIKGTMEGKNFLDPAVAGKLMNQVGRIPTASTPEALKQLSEREIEVLRLVGQGLNNAEIARQLFLSEGTVRNYVSAVLIKLQLSDRTQAAVLAMRSGLV